MSEHGESPHTPLSDEAIERALDRLRHPHPSPLNHHELEEIRRILKNWPSEEELADFETMRKAWRFKHEKSEEFRKRWPMVVAAISVLGTAATVTISLVVNFFQSGGGHK